MGASPVRVAPTQVRNASSAGGAGAGYLDAARRAVTEASGWRRPAIAAGAGAVSVLSLAPFFLWPVLFFTLPVLVWLIDGPTRSSPALRRDAMHRAAVVGWWFGFGYFFCGLYWIGEAFLVEADKFGWALPFAVTLMPAGLALFWAGAAAAARAFWHPGLSRVLVLAVALSGAEWLRGTILTGFPWNVLGYALTFPLAFMQSAAVLGIYGLTLLALIVFPAPVVLAADAPPGPARRRAAATGLVIAGVPLLLLAAYGVWRLSQPLPPDVAGVALRIVQPSVPQRDKWRPEKQAEIFRDHLDLSRQDAAGTRDDLRGVTHLVWPEAAMPFLPLEEPRALAAIGELLQPDTYLLTGALRRELPDPGAPPGARRRAYNSLMVFAPGGGLAAIYDKIHLVPFGEYLPLQAALESIGLEQLTRLRGGFSAGAEPRPLLPVAGLPPVAGLICYEAIFPNEIVVDLASRPGVLVNVTNDGWFGDSIGPRQHLHQARVRAVEQGLPMIRAANNGISAVIDANGRLVAWLGLNVRGVIDSRLPGALPPPLYARLGSWTFAICAVIIAALAFTISFPQRRNGGLTDPP